MMMDKPLRVLAITNMYPSKENPGDSPAVKDQVEMLRKLGLDVDLMIIERNRMINYLKAGWRIFKTNFKPKKYDILHGYYGHCGAIACVQFHSPVIVTFRGSDILTLKDGWIGQIAARLAKRVVVMSQEMKSKSLRKDAFIIPFGVELSVFHPQDTAAARQELGYDQGTKYILFPYDPSRSVKRIDIAREMITELNRRGMKSELVILHSESPEKVARTMNACDLLILTSDHEGSPMAVREAMACNLPIVSTDVGDVKELLSGVEESVIATQDANALADASEKILKSGKRSNGSIKIAPYSNRFYTEKIVQIYQGMVMHGK